VLWSEDRNAPREWLVENIPGAAGLLCMLTDKPIDGALLDIAGPNLQVVSTVSVGYDHIDFQALSQRNIKLGHTPDVLTEAVADITVMLALMASRNGRIAVEAVEAGKWPSTPWSLFAFCGPQISSPGYIVGFVGFGRIAQATLRRLRSFGIDRFLYNDTGRGPSRESADVDLRQQFNLKELRRVGLDELAAECDLIITLTPGGALTHHLVNESFLRKMKKTAILVNPSRGTVVDSNALALALKESWIWAAGLDVVEGEPNVGLDHPLVQQPRAVLLPHIGSATFETRIAMACTAAENLIRALAGEPLLAEVKQ